jgi:hypothetical protein
MRGNYRREARFEKPAEGFGKIVSTEGLGVLLARIKREICAGKQSKGKSCHRTATDQKRRRRRPK